MAVFLHLMTAKTVPMVKNPLELNSYHRFLTRPVGFGMLCFGCLPASRRRANPSQRTGIIYTVM
jgi:hypothetical protein